MTDAMSDLLQLMIAEGSSALHIQTEARCAMVTLGGFLMEKYQQGLIARGEVVNKS